jgi:hypothetical protein
VWGRGRVRVRRVRVRMRVRRVRARVKVGVPGLPRPLAPLRCTPARPSTVNAHLYRICKGEPVRLRRVGVRVSVS